MGTNVHTVAWENAKITSLILLENEKNDTLAKAFLSFVSNTNQGGSCGGNSCQLRFTCGDQEYLMLTEEIGKQSIVDSLTKATYETFYKHQF